MQKVELFKQGSPPKNIVNRDVAQVLAKEEFIRIEEEATVQASSTVISEKPPVVEKKPDPLSGLFKRFGT